MGSWVDPMKLASLGVGCEKLMWVVDCEEV